MQKPVYIGQVPSAMMQHMLQLFWFFQFTQFSFLLSQKGMAYLSFN